MRVEWNTGDLRPGLSLVSYAGVAHRLAMTHAGAGSAALIRLDRWEIVVIGTLEEVVEVLNKRGFLPGDPVEACVLLASEMRCREPCY